MRSGLFIGLDLGSLLCRMLSVDVGARSAAVVFRHFGQIKSFFFLAFSLAPRVERSEQSFFWWHAFLHVLQVNHPEISFALHMTQLGLGD